MNIPVFAYPAAILWDMDGTLVDTEPYWFRAEQELTSEWGVKWGSEDFVRLIGQGLLVSAQELQQAGVNLEPEKIVGLLVNRVLGQLSENIPWRPGALELLRQAHQAKIPQALVTMSYRRLAKRIAQALAVELGGMPFTAIITGDEVEHAKPHPEAYLHAGQELGVDVTRCVAFEDSVPGVASAVAAGAQVYAVPFQVEIPESPKYTLLPDGLAGIRLSDLCLLAPTGSRE